MLDSKCLLVFLSEQVAIRSGGSNSMNKLPITLQLFNMARQAGHVFNV